MAAHEAPHIRWETAVVTGWGGLRVQGPYSKGSIQGTPREISGSIRNTRNTGVREEGGHRLHGRVEVPDASPAAREGPAGADGDAMSGKEKARANEQGGGSAGPPRAPPSAVPPMPAAAIPESLVLDRRLGSRPVRVGGFLQVWA